MLEKVGWQFFKWLALAGFIWMLDQGSKYAVVNSLQYGESFMVTSFFDLTLVYNKGAAFGFLAHVGGWQKWFFIIFATLVSVWIVWMLYQQQKERYTCFSFSLILGGALGNVTDRLIYGSVVDFLDFHVSSWYFPAFNIADSAICIGVCILLIKSFETTSTEGTTG